MLCCASAAVLATAPCALAAPVLPGAVQPGRDRPQPELPSEPNFDFRLESPQRSPVPRAVDEIRFKLNDIRVVGATVIPTQEFRPLFAPLIGKDVTLSDILNIADMIEARYRADGFILVRAYVPPQRVQDGVFTIDVVEGYVASVSVEGSNEDTQDVTKDYLTPVLSEKPLTLPTMERALLLANDLPGVSATGVLRPSATTPGASDLVVSETQPDWGAGLSLNNRGSRFSGIWTLTANVAANGLFGPDQLSGQVTMAPTSVDQQIAGLVRYRRAIGSDGLIGSLFGVITHGQPGSTLAQFNVLTDSWAVGPRLTYPLIRSRAETLSIDGGFTAQDARVDVLSIPSHDQWRVLDLSVSYLRSGLLDASWAGTLDVAQGLPIFGATPNKSPELSRSGALTDFTKLTGTARVTRPIYDALGVTLAAQGQFSFAPLVNGEQISFGGLQIGRGYDPGAITGDRGIGGSAEFHYDTRIPEWSINALQPYVFIEGANTWFIHAAAAGLANYSIASVGGGFRFWLPFNIAGDVELDRTLNAVPGSDGGHQATKVLMDAGISF